MSQPHHTTKNTPGRLWRLCQKELKETSRDRRTIVTLLLMPLLVYPLLSMAMNRYLLTADSSVEVKYRIAVSSDAEGTRLNDLLCSPESVPPDEVLSSSSGKLAEFVFFNTSDTENGTPLTPVQALENGVVEVAAKLVEENDGRYSLTLKSFAGDATSQNARRIIVERMQWLKLAFAERVAEAVDPNFKPPVDVTVAEVGEPTETPILATIVPLVLVLMTITGAVYPAIDLTAGERERGTMEALMASPVPRFYVLLAKYVAVVTVALLTALANLLAMFTTLWLGGLLPLLTGGDPGFPWLAVLQILGLLVLFSGFFSAVLLSLTSFARSFKEAQAYLIPVMLFAITPGMLSLMPGVELSGPLAIAPLINIVLLAREVLGGTVQPAAAGAAVLSTMGYAAAALGIAAKLFGSDAVTRTSEQSIGSLFRRPKKWTDVASPQAAALVLALLVPIYFVLSNVLMQYLVGVKASMLGGQADLTDTQSAGLQIRSMILSAMALVVVFGFVPAIAAWFGRNRPRTTFRLRRPSIAALFGALVIGLGAWAIAHEAFVLAEALGVGGLSEEKIAQTRKVLKAWKLVPPWVLLGTLAATPAIIEELCFRGFLFSSFRRVMKPWQTITLTALLFGLFHVLTGNALLIERFVPSTLLGLLLGWIAYRSGSVLPGMVMHFVHNGLLELVGHYHEKLNFLGADFDNQTHLPPMWIAIATAIAVIGILMVWAGTRTKTLATVPAH
ncbi:ABC transporter permease subunit/CPBP intramembrane protease [Rubripirellula reticaptiva]|uniref:ABC-2 family transporter protein n=1 Tax=Rubripirellula reticaptiva TaxID=2528013 RepID=A0A5C6EDS2_9BACT|nr:ABC transporter permease subunit/CPBP intramembrane protease [Rubripirellula reticaptiva]TWU47873.1 ABC-2 family transporter protein [Rubripirellula reticaptiva]